MQPRTLSEQLHDTSIYLTVLRVYDILLSFLICVNFILKQKKQEETIFDDDYDRGYEWGTNETRE